MQLRAATGRQPAPVNRRTGKEQDMAQGFISINGTRYAFEPGQTLFQVAEANDIRIPSLCYLKGASPTGACRICVVEVKGYRTLAASCSTPAADGMEVLTESPKVVASRKETLELLLASGNHNCAVGAGWEGDWTGFQMKAAAADHFEALCPAWGDCRLQDLAYQYQVQGGKFPRSENRYPMETVNPLIVRDFARCILCGRCVQACNEVQVNRAINFGYRGAAAKIVAGTDVPLKDSQCVFCGECVQACPTAALMEKKARFTWRPWKNRKVRTTCPYCGVGCQQWLHIQDDRIVKVTGVEDGAPNKGRLCVKGRFGYDFIYSEDRLKTPLIREGDDFREASWDEALDLVADKFKTIIAESGPDAVAGVSCARSINEDSYQMQKLFRGVFKTNNIDHCART
jgi:formate dehydrogenase major subunit